MIRIGVSTKNFEDPKLKGFSICSRAKRGRWAFIGNGSLVEPVHRHLHEARVGEALVGAVAQEDRAVVERLEGDVAVPAVGVVFDVLDVRPGAPLVARDRRRERRAAKRRS